MSISRGDLTSQLIRVAIVFCSIVTVSACRPHPDQAELNQKAALEACSNAYRVYADGSVAAARKALVENAHMLEKDTALEPSGRADITFHQYARLYVLDERIGDPDVAALDLLKARYWLLCALEQEQLDEREVILRFKRADTEAISNMVNQLDAKGTGGKGPKYLEEIQLGGPKSK